MPWVPLRNGLLKARVAQLDRPCQVCIATYCLEKRSNVLGIGECLVLNPHVLRACTGMM